MILPAGLLCALIAYSCPRAQQILAAPPPTAENEPKPAITLHTEIEVKGKMPIVEENFLAPNLVASARVTRRQLEDLQATDLLTGLRMTPGVMISRYNLVGSYGGGDGGALFIRGMGSGRPGAEIQFLVDGVPKFSGVWTHPLMDVLSLDAVSRVEVVKGASPVLFGNMTAGAVDIHTRRMEQEGWRAACSVQGGSFGTLVTHADGGFRQGKFDLFLTAGYRTSNGHRLRSAGRLEDVSARFGFALAPGWSLTGTLARTSSYALDPGPAASAPPPRGKFTIRDWTAMIALENSTPAAYGFFRYYRDDGAIRWEQWNTAKSLPEDSDTDYVNWGLRGRQTFRPGDRINVTLGFDGDNYGGSFRHASGTAVDTKDECRMWNAAPYCLVGLDFGKKVQVSPFGGIRYNISQYFGRFAAPEGGVAITAGQTRVHVSASRGFNLPGVYAVFSYQDWKQGDGWKTLRPERILHLEGGISHSFHLRLKMDLTIFRDEGKDAIRFTAPPPRYDNIGHYRTTGMELSMAADPLDTLHAFASFTWLRAGAVKLPYAPEHSAQLGINWDFHPRVRWSSDAQYTGSRWSGNLRYPGQPVSLDAFFLLNTRVRVLLTPETGGQRLELFAGVENATGTKYQYRPGYDMPGAVFAGGLRWSLERLK